MNESSEPETSVETNVDEVLKEMKDINYDIEESMKRFVSACS